MQLVIP